MRHDDQGAALLRQLHEHADHLRLQLGIQRTRRLIKEQVGGFQRQGAGNRHTLLLAARESVRVGIYLVGKTHLRQQLAGTLLRLLSVQGAVEGRGERHVLQRRVVRKQVELLEHHRRTGTNITHLRVGELLTVVHLRVVNGERAGLRGFQQVQAAQQSGLTATGRAQNNRGLAVGDVQADVLEHLRIAEALRQGINAKHCCSLRNGCCTSPTQTVRQSAE